MPLIILFIRLSAHSILKAMKIIELIKKHSSEISMVWNLAYSLFQFYLFLSQRSYRYLALSAFFLILGLGRLLVFSKKTDFRIATRLLVLMMTLLAVTIAGTTYLTINEFIYPIRNKILVIVQAAFSFSLITLAIYNMVVSYKRKQTRDIILRNLSLASAMGSVLSLERTMLGTFGSPSDSFNVIMETVSGFLIFILLLIMAYQLMIIAHNNSN
jgi:hypothetical protein